jgi:hypothetical protein
MGILEVRRRGSSAKTDLSEIECRQRRGGGYQSDEEELSSPRLWLQREGHQLELEWGGRLRWGWESSQKFGARLLSRHRRRSGANQTQQHQHYPLPALISKREAVNSSEFPFTSTWSSFRSRGQVLTRRERAVVRVRRYTVNERRSQTAPPSPR